jgi:hypothetical protein
MNIDPKLLVGLKFHDSVRKEVVKDGAKHFEYTPRERPLKPEDVGAMKDYGDKIVIATTDGKKYTLPKAEKQ